MSKEKKSRDSGVTKERSAALGVRKELMEKKQEVGNDMEVRKNREKEMGVREKSTSGIKKKGFGKGGVCSECGRT